MRGKGAIGLATAMALLAPSTTSASTIRLVPEPDPLGGYRGNVLYYTAAPGEANRVSVEGVGYHQLRVLDPSASIDAPEGCARRDEHEVVCNAMRPVVDTGDGDDEARSATGALGGGTGNDTLVGSDVDGGPGDDVLTGGPADDTLVGGPGRDVARGLGGDDGLSDEGDASMGMRSADTFDGGPGRDAISYPEPAPGLVVDLLKDSGLSGDRLLRIEDVGTDARSVRLAGDSHRNALYAEEGPSVLVGRGGNDYLDASGNARDRLFGGRGNDNIHLWRGSRSKPDELRCGAGVDTVYSPTQDQLVPADCERAEIELDVAYRLAGKLRGLATPVASVAPGRCYSDGPKCTYRWTVRVGRTVIARRRQRVRADREGGWVAIRLTAAGRRVLQRRRVLHAEIGNARRGRIHLGFRIELRAP